MQPTPIDYSKMSKDELLAILCPPAPTLTEKDVRLARGRYVMDTFIDHMMTMADAVRILSAQVESKNEVTEDAAAVPALDDKVVERNDRVLKYAKNIADRFYDQLEEDVSDEGDPWDAFAEHFDKYHKDGLNRMHVGDCTAVASSCERCYAEQLYDLPHSGAWKGKAEGHRIWSNYCRAVDAEKAETGNSADSV